MSARRMVAALLAMMVGAAVISILPSTPPASAAPGDPAPTGSAMTLPGSSPFTSLKVTVSQTKNLINQTVTVTWTGGTPTLPVSGGFGANYLQIMQCWGDDPGPDRTQCQFGGSVTQLSPSAGDWVRSRQVTYGNLVDANPKEIKAPAGTFGGLFVPFWAAGKPQPTDPATSNRNDFFDAQVTNEIPLGRTHGDGTGQEFFEIQTVRQAAGLGCGDPVTPGAATGRKCWLVVVPRGTQEVDGTNRSGVANTDRLNSSPLSLSNWDKRIVFPLEFLPVGKACPIGAPERRLVGHELASDAVSSWQPALCAGGGALYSYTQLGDDVIRNQVLDGSTPGLALLTNPIPSDPPPNQPLVYAPVGLSGLAIAFNIEHQPRSSAKPEQLQLDGQRFLSMKLTPRLVAKLLTQSYRGAVEGQPEYLKNNPRGLTLDPEFLALNPEYTDFADSTTPPDALVQINGSDLTALLWNWVAADPKASAFLAGKPDDFNMVVNKNNLPFNLPTSTFPRNDQNCVDVTLGAGVAGKICTLDTHPFTTDMHDAGLSASRGDSQARTTVLGDDGKTPTPKKVDRQVPGQRAILAVVDAATATRYGLPTAALLNTAGSFVAPTTKSLQAGEGVMKPSEVSGVLASDPTTTDAAAYPLTALSYAVTAPSKLEKAAGKDYATFLRYAAGKGQEQGVAPGQLPFGMAPLPDVLKAQTIAAAATIEAQAGATVSGTVVPPPISAGAGTAGSTGGSNGAVGTGGTATASGSGSGALSPSVAPQGVSSPVAKVPSVAQQPVARTQRTPSLASTAVSLILAIVLICGVLAATSSPVMYVLGGAGRRMRKDQGKEVVPTEQ